MADVQTQASSQKSTPPATKRERRAFPLALATSIAILWLAFLSSFGLSIAQRAGQAAGPPFLSFAQSALAWAERQSPIVQFSLIVLVIYATACVAWFTVWAWSTRAAARQREEAAAITAEGERFEASITHAAGEPLAGIALQAGGIAASVDAIRSETGQYASESEARDTQLAGLLAVAGDASRQQSAAILQQGITVEAEVHAVADQIAVATATKYTITRVKDLNVTGGFRSHVRLRLERQGRRPP